MINQINFKDKKIKYGEKIVETYHLDSIGHDKAQNIVKKGGSLTY